MSTMSTGHFGKLLWPGINKIYGDAYNEYPKQYSEIFKFNKSTRSYEEDVGVTGFPLASIISEGEGVSFAQIEQSYVKRYTHIKYGLGFILSEELYDDNQYQRPMLTRAQGLAFSIRQTKEVVGANILNRASNDDYPGGDAVGLLSLVHPNKSGGTWANEPSTATDISEIALEQACIDIGKFTMDGGLTIAVRPVKLVVPVDLEAEANRILMGDWQVNSGERNINFLKTSGKFPQGIKVNNYITDTDAWFIITDCPNGLNYFERTADTFTEDNDWDTENAKFKAKFRCSFGHTDARCCYGSMGA